MPNDIANDIFRGPIPKKLLRIYIPCLEWMGDDIPLDTLCSIKLIYPEHTTETYDIYTLKDILNSDLLLYARTQFRLLQQLFQQRFPTLFNPERIKAYKEKGIETQKEFYEAMIPYKTITKIEVNMEHCAESGPGCGHYVTFYSTEYPKGVSSRALLGVLLKYPDMGYLSIKDIVTFYAEHVSIDVRLHGERFLNEADHKRFVETPLKGLLTNLTKVSRVALPPHKSNKDESLAPYKGNHFCLELTYKDGHQTTIPLLESKHLVQYFREFLDDALLKKKEIQYYLAKNKGLSQKADCTKEEQISPHQQLSFLAQNKVSKPRAGLGEEAQCPEAEASIKPV